jgi:hypothetical protein
MVHRKLKLKLLKIIVTVDNIIFFFTKVTILFKNKNVTRMQLMLTMSLFSRKDHKSRKKNFLNNIVTFEKKNIVLSTVTIIFNNFNFSLRWTI